MGAVWSIRLFDTIHKATYQCLYKSISLQKPCWKSTAGIPRVHFVLRWHFTLINGDLDNLSHEITQSLLDMVLRPGDSRKQYYEYA